MAVVVFDVARGNWSSRRCCGEGDSRSQPEESEVKSASGFCGLPISVYTYVYDNRLFGATGKLLHCISVVSVVGSSWTAVSID